MLPGDAYHNAVDGQLGIFFGQRRRPLNGINGLDNIRHHASLHPQARGFAHSNDFDFAKFVALTDNGNNFGGAYVQADCDFLHGVGIHSCNE
jgi:hypothetical protein